jgi:hypothetical protein
MNPTQTDPQTFAGLGGIPGLFGVTLAATHASQDWLIRYDDDQMAAPKEAHHVDNAHE